jgi:nucleotide-binding universal stress UspA family protein
MYSKIVVPLDSSEIAEQALSHAAEIARRFEAELELLTVVPASPDDGFPHDGPGDEWDPRTLEAQEYVEAVAGRLREDGIKATTSFRRGDVAEEILAHTRDTECDLIVMCTHGRSGRGRWVYGSIADRTLRYATVPVLLVRAAEE